MGLLCPIASHGFVLLFFGYILINPTVSKKTWTYYMTAEDVVWDYGPGGMDLANASAGNTDVFLKNSNDRIGGIYTKTVYKRYTNRQYDVEVQKPAWMGILGPVIKAEVGDDIEIHFLNHASRPYTMHPHGVFYDKDSEGAMYVDNTSGDDKADDSVPGNGGTHTYIWKVNAEFAPTRADPNCIVWMYHSHLLTTKDTDAGLVGALVTCKKGTLNDDGSRKDGVEDIFLLLKIFDENLSWHIEENMERCGDEDACITLLQNGDADFKLSNELYSINGMIYGNLPAIPICAHTRVAVHLIGIGSQLDLHSFRIKGQTMVYHDRRVVAMSLFPADFKTAEMIPTQPGRWLISCESHTHFDNGMLAFLDVTDCGNQPITETDTEIVNERTYYISAEETEWNYGPSGMDLLHDIPLTVMPGPTGHHFSKMMNRIGGIYLKDLYFEYTDGTFSEKKIRTGNDLHLGLLGPVIRAEVGERVTVVFKNMATRPYSISPDGLLTDKANEGARYEDGTSVNSDDDATEPGTTQTYSWTIPESVAPTRYDMNCNTYIYHSGVSQAKDTITGLIGPLLVCKRGTLDDNGQQRGIDHEFILLASVIPEHQSWKFEENIQRYTMDPDNVPRDDMGWITSNDMGGLNGLMFANMPGLEACIGDRISWHIMGSGTGGVIDTDNHPIYFRGNSLTTRYHNGDTFTVFPGTTVTALMIPDNPGIWAITCMSTEHHVHHGITARYNISTCGRRVKTRYRGRRRRYYIAAVEIMWDYHPDRDNPVFDPDDLGQDIPSPFSERNHTLFKKVVFREYTNKKFRTMKSRGKDEEHLGIQGPTIFAEVGDIIEVVFKNLASRPYSLHTHGVMFTKDNEGEPYEDSSPLNSDESVVPGMQYIYRWRVPKRTGPGRSDPNCISYPYYSAIHPSKDIASGLVGTTVICRRHTLSNRNRFERNDAIDREFSVMFFIFDETESWYFTENVARIYSTSPDISDPIFIHQNKFYTINGYIFEHNSGLTMYKNERIAWYISALGSQFDFHPVHFHGQSMIYRDIKPHRVDVIDVFPAKSETVEMEATNIGTWLLHCHVDLHILNGMETTYIVKDVDPGTGRDKWWWKKWKNWWRNNRWHR